MNGNEQTAGLPERTGYLVLLATAPALWLTHFMVTYITASIWCAKYAGETRSLTGAYGLIASYTIVAVAGIVFVGVSGYRRHTHGNESVPHDMDTAEDRHRFLGFATMLLAGLSFIATIYVTGAVWTFESCR